MEKHPELEGKRVVVVEDSIVRGTTSKNLVDMIRQAGAYVIEMTDLDTGEVTQMETVDVTGMSREDFNALLDNLMNEED